MFESQSLEEIHLVKNSVPSWYDRRFCAFTEFPERFPAWKISEEKLYHYRPNYAVTDFVDDLNGWKLVPKDDERQSILQKAHDDPQSGQLGTQKTSRRVSLSYYWPGYCRDVNKYVRSCTICQTCKVEQLSPAGLMGHRAVEEPWIVVATDIMGPLPRSRLGFQYILVIQDLFTKWVEIAPLRLATGKKIESAFRERIHNRWGSPKVLLTDNGTEFVNGVLRQLAEEFNIIHTTTTPYHSQANPVERINRILKMMIISSIEKNHNTWDQHLSEFQFAYNSTYHTSLKSSPAFLNFGRDPVPTNSLRKRIDKEPRVESRNPESWQQKMDKIQSMRDWVIKNLDDVFAKQSGYYNLRHRKIRFHKGDLVLSRCRVLSSKVKNISTKLNPKFIGPYRISNELSPTVYELCDLSNKFVNKSHIQDLKPFIPPNVSVNSDP